jgi:hypothetical protein
MTRQSLAAAVVVSLVLHAATGWALGHLRSEGGTPEPQPPESLAVSHVLLPRATVGQGKLAPGDSMPPAPVESLLPPAAEFVVPVTMAASTQLGPALADVPSGPPGAKSGLGASSGSSPGGVPSGAATTFFGVPARGQTIVYLLDRSCSMGLHGALATARRELLSSLEHLPASASFQVIFYNSSPQPLLGRHDELMPATAENLQRAAAAMDLIQPEGGTRHYQGFQAALYLHPDVLFFLTDADDLTCDDAHAILKLNAGKTVIHTIELTLANQGRLEMPMQRLAQATGGTYRAVDQSTLR